MMQSIMHPGYDRFKIYKIHKSSIDYFSLLFDKLMAFSPSLSRDGWIFPNSEIEFSDTVIGRGAFGEVILL